MASVKVRLTVRKSEKGDGYILGPNLREDDKREVEAVTGDDPGPSLEASIWQCDDCWTVDIGEDPIAMFGCTRSEDTDINSANVWLLVSDQVEEVRWQFLRESKQWIKRLSRDYAMLWAIADARNKRHKEYYEWLGFVVVGTEPYGPKGLPFHRIIYIPKEGE